MASKKGCSNERAVLVVGVGWGWGVGFEFSVLSSQFSVASYRYLPYFYFSELGGVNMFFVLSG